jgi:formylglycine-generating enzyme
LDATQANLAIVHLNGEPSRALPTDFPAFWACDWGEDSYGLWMAFRYRAIRQQLRWIVPGEFMMGSPTSEADRDDDETPHRVILSQGFWLADTACTQALWQAVMGSNPSRFQGEELPVEQVSWNDVQDFIERLNTVAPGGGFRLPTEAEWEYACRAGTTTAFWFGDQITPEQVNYNGNYPYAGGRQGLYREATVTVKALPCNSWGLYQMHGNVWEWCQDWYGTYPKGTIVDPSGPSEGGPRVLRGGCWFIYGRFVRSAFRLHVGPGDRIDDSGFRRARGQVPSEQVAGENRTASAGQT